MEAVEGAVQDDAAKARSKTALWDAISVRNGAVSFS
jgi:hypothetical protein